MRATPRHIFRTLALLYAGLILSLTVPIFSGRKLNIWFFACVVFLVIVPGLFYAVVGLFHPAWNRNSKARSSPVAVMRTLAAAYVGLAGLAIVGLLFDRDVPQIIIVPGQVAMMILYVSCVESQLRPALQPVTAQHRWLTRLPRWIANTVGRGAGTTTLLFGAALVFVGLCMPDTRSFLLGHGSWITAKYGVGSETNWGQALETALGYVLLLSGLVLSAATLLWMGISRFHPAKSGATLPKWAGWVAASVSAIFLSDLYFGWLYLCLRTAGALGRLAQLE